jgi:hypothetical protein
MNVVMTGAGGFVEVQGTAEGAAFTRTPRWTSCWPGRAQGIRRAGGFRRRSAGCWPSRADRMSTAMRLVLASNNAKKLAELQALFAGCRSSAGGPGPARHHRGRRAALTFIENALAKARHAARPRGCRRSPTIRVCA